MKVRAVLCVLSLLIGGVALMPSSLEAAGWISGAATSVVPWVKDIEQELWKKDYRDVYANDPRTPRIVALRFLNQAANAQEANDRALAQQLVQEALEVFEEGERGHYYSLKRNRADHVVYPSTRPHQDRLNTGLAMETMPVPPEIS